MYFYIFHAGLRNRRPFELRLISFRQFVLQIIGESTGGGFRSAGQSINYK